MRSVLGQVISIISTISLTCVIAQSVNASTCQPCSSPAGCILPRITSCQNQTTCLSEAPFLLERLSPADEALLANDVGKDSGWISAAKDMFVGSSNGEICLSPEKSPHSYDA